MLTYLCAHRMAAIPFAALRKSAGNGIYLVVDVD